MDRPDPGGVDTVDLIDAPRVSQCHPQLPLEIGGSDVRKRDRSNVAQVEPPVVGQAQSGNVLTQHVEQPSDNALGLARSGPGIHQHVTLRIVCCGALRLV